MTRHRTRIAVLASGGGSNLQALLDHSGLLGEQRSGDVILVASERAGSRALERARAAGIDTALIASRFAPDAKSLAQALNESSIDLIVLAGFLQMIPREVVSQFRNHVINVHPGPLPQFGGPGMYGERVHRAVLDAGASRSGATVHYVDEVYDRGPVIAHWPVAVRAGDDVHSLLARVLRAEHALYPRVIDMVARGAPARGVEVLPLFDETMSIAQLGAVVDDHLHATERVYDQLTHISH